MYDHKKDIEWLKSKGFYQTLRGNEKQTTWRWAIDPCVFYINVVVPNDPALGCYSVISIGAYPENLLQREERSTAEESVTTIVEEVKEKEWMLEGVSNGIKKAMFSTFLIKRSFK